MDLSIASKDIPRTALVVLELDGDLKKKVTIAQGSSPTAMTVDKKVKFTHSAEITRFLLRIGKLLDEYDPANQYHWSLIDSVLAGNATSLVNQRKHKFLLGDDVSLVDYLAWASLPPQTNEEYEELLSQTSACAAVSALAKEYAQSAQTTCASSIEGANPSTSPMDVFKIEIARQLAGLSGLDASTIYNVIELPRSLDNGDLAVAIPRLRLQGNPAERAKKWAQGFVIDSKIITEATAIGPFLNFRICTQTLVRNTLKAVSEKGDKYGNNDSGNGKTVVVEFSSPNIAKPFHAGHLRSTIIGSFITNVYKANGWKTVSMNYLGDWGKQYGLLAVGYAKYGDDVKLKNDAIKHLYDVYVEINRDAEKEPTIHDEAREYFRQMESGNEDALSRWRLFRDLSIVKYQEVYERLNITFDVYSGESQVGKGMDEAMGTLKDLNLLKDSQSAKVIDLEAYKLGTALVQKKDGTTLYLTRDIGAAKERYEKYKFDKMVYVVASQQDLHLKQLFKTLELMGFEWADKCEHVNFGMVQGMSTRKGTVVFLEDILDEACAIMHDQMRKNEAKYQEIEEPWKVADEVGISGVKIQDNSARRVKNYEFDRNRMFSFEGDTGPYIQYAHARLRSIEENSGQNVDFSADVGLLTEKKALDLIRTVAYYPDLVRSLTKEYEPCNVVTYAFKLAHDISSAFGALWVKGAEPEVAKARLLMYWSARMTLGNAIRLLGLKPLDKM